MLGIGSLHSHSEVALVADIESGGASIAVALMPPTGPARIVASDKASLSAEDRDQAHAASGVTTLLPDLVAKVLKRYSESEVGREHGTIASVHAIVGAPFV